MNVAARIKRWREEPPGDETEGTIELLCDAEERLNELETRRDELLALVRNISLESVTPEQAATLNGQVAALIAEVGTLRGEVKGLERFKALRLRHNEEMSRRTSRLAQANMDLGVAMKALKNIADRRCKYCPHKDDPGMCSCMSCTAWRALIEVECPQCKGDQYVQPCSLCGGS